MAKRHDSWIERLWQLFNRAFFEQRNSLRVTNENESLFGESLTVQRTPIIELNSSYGTSRLRDVKRTTGSGAVTDSPSTGEIFVESGTTAGSTARLDSAEVGRYIPGYAAELGFGVRFTALPLGDQEFLWGGLGSDAKNGFYFGYDSNGLYLARRRAGVELDKTYQEGWNLDPLDGTGPSGYTIDVTLGYIYQIDFSWYGYGAVHFGVIIDYGGEQRFTPVHVMKEFAEGTSIASPNLRVSVLVNNNTTEQNAKVYVGGRQYSIVGNYIPKYRFTGDFRSSTDISTTVTPLVSFRRKDGEGDKSIKLEELSAIVGSEDVYLEIRLQGTLSAPNWRTPTDYSDDETALEVDTEADGIDGGDVVWTQLAAAGQNKNSTQFVSAEVDFDVPNGYVIALCARTLTGTGSIISHLNMREEW